MNMSFDALHNYVSENCDNICQIVAIKNGETFYEDYWHGFVPADAVNVMSVTKSVTSLLIGIAMDRGLIKSLDAPVLDFFPGYQIKRGEKTIHRVTLRHLLTMTAPYKCKSEPWTKVCTSLDWTNAALDILGGKAGITGEFKYSTLGIQILMGIIASAGGMKTIDFANEFLFEPIGVSPHVNLELETVDEHKEFVMSKSPRKNAWVADPKGVNTAGWGLCLTARDMAKIGSLCLNRGTCDGKTVVSGEWMDEIARPRFNCGEKFGNMSYGYLWWIPDDKKPAYAASGTGGNVIYVNPASRVVVAVTSLFNPRVFDRIEFVQRWFDE